MSVPCTSNLSPGIKFAGTVRSAIPLDAIPSPWVLGILSFAVPWVHSGAEIDACVLFTEQGNPVAVRTTSQPQYPLQPQAQGPLMQGICHGGCKMRPSNR